jgi:hypothetical protein
MIEGGLAALTNCLLQSTGETAGFPRGPPFPEFEPRAQQAFVGRARHVSMKVGLVSSWRVGFRVVLGVVGCERGSFLYRVLGWDDGAVWESLR